MTETTLEQDMIKFKEGALRKDWMLFAISNLPEHMNLLKNIREKWKKATPEERKKAFVNTELDFQKKILQNLPSFVRTTSTEETTDFEEKLKKEIDYAEELGLFNEEVFNSDKFAEILFIAQHKEKIPEDPEERTKELEKDREWLSNLGNNPRSRFTGHHWRQLHKGEQAGENPSDTSTQGAETTLEQDIRKFHYFDSPGPSDLKTIRVYQDFDFVETMGRAPFETEPRNLLINIRKKWKEATPAERRKALENAELDFLKGTKDPALEEKIKKRMDYAEDLGLFNEEVYPSYKSLAIFNHTRWKNIPEDPQERAKALEEDKKFLSPMLEECKAHDKFFDSLITWQAGKPHDSQKNSLNTSKNQSNDLNLEDFLKIFTNFFMEIAKVIQQNFSGIPAIPAPNPGAEMIGTGPTPPKKQAQPPKSNETTK